MSDVVIIGTVASSFYGFRADLIRTLLKKGHRVYQSFPAKKGTSQIKGRSRT